MRSKVDTKCILECLLNDLMELVVQLRDLDEANLEEGVILKIEYPDVPNVYFQIVVQELDEDSVLETTIDKRIH